RTRIRNTHRAGSLWRALDRLCSRALRFLVAGQHIGRQHVSQTDTPLTCAAHLTCGKYVSGERLHMSFENKVALITGGASGIGRATAVVLAERGANVVVSDIDPEGGEAAVAEILAAGGNASFVQADVTDPAAVEGLVARSVELFGGLHC